MGERHLARLRHEASSTDETGRRHGKMRRADRPLGDEAGVFRQETRNRVDPGHLEGFRVRQRRQDAAQTAREHGFAAAGTSPQQKVVAAGGGELERLFRQGLSAHIGEVCIVVLYGSRRFGRPLGNPIERALAAKEPHRLREMVDREHVDAADERRLARVRAREQDRALARLRRRHRARERAANPPDRAVERQLAEQAHLAESFLRDPAVCGEHAERDREIEARPGFAEMGRREVDRDPLHRPFLVARENRGSDPFARFLDRRVGQSHQRELGKARGECDLDLDGIAVEPDDRDRFGLGDAHGSERSLEVRDERATAAGTHLDHVEADRRCGRPLLHQEQAREPADANLLAPRDGFTGRAEPVGPPGLHLDERQHPGALGDDVDLTRAAASNVAADDPPSLFDEETSGDVLAGSSKLAASHPRDDNGVSGFIRGDVTLSSRARTDSQMWP